MKKNYFIHVLFLLFTLPIFSQENIVKIAAIGSDGDIIGIQYERSLTDRISILGTIGYASFSYDEFMSDSYATTSSTTTGFGLNAEGRYYFTKNKDLMEGWHAGAYLDYKNTEGEGEYYHEDIYINTFGIGLSGGYQFVFSPSITLDLFVGGGFEFEDSDFSNSAGDGFYPLGGISLGYNF